MQFLVKDINFTDQTEWLETGCVDLHRYVDLLTGVENIARAEARTYNQEQCSNTITCIKNMRTLPDAFRQQLATRLASAYSVKITADYLYSVETLENVSSAIFSAHEQIRFEERLQSCPQH